MKKISKLLMVVSLSVVLSSAALAGDGSKGTDTKKSESKFLTLGGSAATSPFHVFCTVYTNLMNEAYKDIRMTIIETAGGVDNTSRIMRGEIELNSTGSVTYYSAYRGLAPFVGKKDEHLRTLFLYAKETLNIVVRKDTGITSLSGLKGQSFSGGGTGTTAATIVDRILELLKIETKPYKGGMTDAQNAFQNRQIVGLVKGGMPPDTYVTTLAATIPIKILSLSDSEAAIVRKELSGLVGLETFPANTYPGESAFTTPVYYIIVSATDRLAEDVGYKTMELITSEKGKKSLKASYHNAAVEEFAEMTINNAPTPLHSGVVRWLKEHGYEVPQRLIPPEYKK